MSVDKRITSDKMVILIAGREYRRVHERKKAGSSLPETPTGLQRILIVKEYEIWKS